MLYMMPVYIGDMSFEPLALSHTIMIWSINRVLLWCAPCPQTSAGVLLCVLSSSARQATVQERADDHLLYLHKYLHTSAEIFRQLLMFSPTWPKDEFECSKRWNNAVHSRGALEGGFVCTVCKIWPKVITRVSWVIIAIQVTHIHS